VKPVIKKLFLYSTGAFLTIFLLGTITVLGLYAYLNPKLPDIDTLKDVRLQVPLRVYSKNRELLAEFGKMKRSPLKYEEFPLQLINAVLAAEDDRFFEHPGVDYKGLLRASFQLIRSGGEKRQGGSTITMQVARNFFLSREKTFVRKFNEIFLALKIENELSKEDILALYLNKIFLGNRAYGFAAAAQVYYGKPLAELTLAETATLAGLPKAPSRFNPVVNPERAMERRSYVLRRMHELEFISEEEFELANREEDRASVHAKDVAVEAPYVAEMVRSEMLKRFGNEAYSAGFEVYTTIDASLQQAANQSLRNALLEYDRRHGYRGIIQHVELVTVDDIQDTDEWQQLLSEISSSGNLVPAIIFEIGENDAYAYTQDNRIAYLPWEHINWARRYIDENTMGPPLKNVRDILQPGDIIYVGNGSKDIQSGVDDKQRENEIYACSWLAQIPEVSGALVSLNPQNGAINALVGGFDYYQSKFNRVTQAERQPGSSFKPFIYAAAIDKGYTAASIINDAPVVFDAPGLEDTWRPENYSGKIYGETRLRQALVKSRNLVSIRLLRDIGIGYAVRYARRFGLENAKLPRDLSLALGSGTLTPLELATGYSIFANGGYHVTPNFIDYLKGPDGRVIELGNPLVVCPECIDKLEQQKLEQEAGAENVNEKEDKQDVEPAVLPEQADSLQAFLVSDDKELTLEESINRELQFAEGPQPLLPAPRILTPQTAYIMNSMMRDVIRMGTGVRARQLGRNDLAGKTGTTNDQRDAWFSGFNNDVVTIAWVGFDQPVPLGSRETGARAALPMWMSFMREALKGKPETQLVQPPGIVSVRINAKTGKPTIAGDPEAIFEYFLEDQVPANEDGTTIIKQQNQPTDITREIF
jgi:penicillin-binding protein 1A